jgi:hypothetical protein
MCAELVDKIQNDSLMGPHFVRWRGDFSPSVAISIDITHACGPKKKKLWSVELRFALLCFVLLLLSRYWLQTGFGLVIGFTAHLRNSLTTSNHSATAN